ncbi:uncharacterized protein LOC116013152 [Ipomoea triloba]|uniref:uncharacterized protein LOC116013152 n=1 Tax=Ipomoea triloba TaxID=35885 RepID=UPI00125D62A0|nr:uncharacterized protein LOC116013152 [Ipomoea triloba]
MRKLFVILLTSNLVNRPENVWNVVWQHLAEYVQFNKRKVLQQEDLCLSDDEKKNLALIEIELLLQSYNKTLKDYPHMPLPNYDDVVRCDNRLLWDELDYDRDALLKDSQTMERQLTDEQKVVYETVVNDVDHQKGGLYFVYGYGGTGKTFVWRALSAKIRSRGDIVINVASSGIASLLLPGGRTTHSRFAIPIAVTEDSTCNITQGSSLAELIIQCKLIIWDEAPMMHKHCFEALDRTLRDLFRFTDQNAGNRTFGGKTVVLGGDFRQILLVIPRGSRQDIVSASINTSYLWDSCQESLNGILADMHTPEFLNGLKASGIPNHALTLKVGSPVMLLRNIDHSMGLCNGTRLIITRLSDHVVEAKIVTGNNAGQIVLIPRMSMTPTDTRLPFKFQRRQFPLMLSYAMTINKSQGQTLTHVGLLLRKPVFVHVSTIRFLIANEDPTYSSTMFVYISIHFMDTRVDW